MNSKNRCNFKKCKNKKYKGNLGFYKFCGYHRKRATISAFLGTKYTYMLLRTKGKCTNKPHLYLNKPIINREVFITWAKNHGEFLALYKTWVSSNFDRKLTPVVNRINPNKGYTLDNMEWVTNSINCGLSASVIKMKNKKAVYKLLGVELNEK